MEATEPEVPTAIDRAIEHAGGQSKLARKCGVRPQAVQNWQRRQRLPAERVIQVETITGVPRTELRPDIYPPSEARTGTS